MQVTIHPSLCRGSVAAPPSKSMSHRLLICAGLSEGTSTVSNIAFSDDVLATVRCLHALGASVETLQDSVTVRGIGSSIAAREILPCGECGSTMRFFIGIGLLGTDDITLSGSHRLLQRPLTVYEDLCRNNNLRLDKTDTAVTVRGKLRPGRYDIDGSISSQFVSGLLFALPLLDGDSTIVMSEPIESRPYIDMTVAAMKTFGVYAEWLAPNQIFIKGSQVYKACNAVTEGDWSNAAFFIAAGSDVTVTGLDEHSLQGDKICCDYFERLSRSDAVLDISDCPDLGPILFAFAASHNGGTFTGTDRLRIKESDRVASMQEELLKTGAVMTDSGDSVTIRASRLHKPEQIIDSHNDHRIAMAMATLLLKTGGTICGAECVSKSMPDFFKKLEALGAVLEYK